MINRCSVGKEPLSRAISPVNIPVSKIMIPASPGLFPFAGRNGISRAPFRGSTAAPTWVFGYPFIRQTKKGSVLTIYIFIFVSGPG